MWYEIHNLHEARDKHKTGLPTCFFKVAASLREMATKTVNCAAGWSDNGSQKDPVMHTDAHGSFALNFPSYDVMTGHYVSCMAVHDSAVQFTEYRRPKAADVCILHAPPPAN